MIAAIGPSAQTAFDRLACHPLQTWAWGEFRRQTGLAVSRFGRFEGKKLVETAQISWHRLPHLPLTVGYWPKGVIPSAEMVEAVSREANRQRAILVKLEPNILAETGSKTLQKLTPAFPLRPGRPQFTRYSLWLDLTPDEETLLKKMHPKTRYNTRLAERKGVKVELDNSLVAFEAYWRLTAQTAQRQGFYAHSRAYHQSMFDLLQPVGLAHLFTASFNQKILAAWIVFTLNGVLYYPYGASTREDRQGFASNLLMWTVIKWAKKHGCRLFDMWGSPGPDPQPTDDWYGFHRFKLGYGARVVEFVGTYDLITNPILYPVYRFGNDFLRWQLLRLKAKIHF